MAPRKLVFAIVGEGDVPMFLMDLSTGQKDVSKAWLDQMVLHASLDLVDESKWQQQQPFLKTVDRFNDMPVVAYVTPGHVTMLAMHDLRGGEDALKQFFAEVHEAYLKQQLSPFHRRDAAIQSPAFQSRVLQAAKKHLL